MLDGSEEGGEAKDPKRRVGGSHGAGNFPDRTALLANEGQAGAPA